MMKDKNRQLYKAGFEGIEVSKESMEKVLGRTVYSKRKTGHWKMKLVIPVCVVMVLLSSLSVGAVNFYQSRFLKVFFVEGIEKSERASIQKKLLKTDGVVQVTFEGGDEAWEAFQKEYLQEIDISQFKENPLKNSDCFNVRIANDVDYKEMKAELAKLQGVRLVNDYQDKEE
ncbi:MAG: permease-like cell division protein FtsX [Lachnospiraceae bacterium]|nr:permease-like cell division protein FtsX [Lachnospiraceae bacterium]